MIVSVMVGVGALAAGFGLGRVHLSAKLKAVEAELKKVESSAVRLSCIGVESSAIKEVQKLIADFRKVL